MNTLPAVTAALGALLIPAGAAPVVWWTTGSMARTGKSDAPGTADAVRIEACRNERESFQVITRGGAGPCPFRIGPLTMPDGSALPAPQIMREGYVRVIQSSPHAPLPAGDYPDVLLPADGTAERGTESGINQPWWVEISVPAGAAPGVYQAAVLLEDGRSIPLSVTVWPVTLPAALPLRSAVGCHWRRIAELHGLKADFSSVRLRTLVGQYHALLSAHGLTPDEPPPLGVECDPAGNLTHFPEAEFARLFSRLHFTTLALPIYADWPFAEPLGKDRTAAKRYLIALLREMKRCGWEDRVCLSCPVDEPADSAAFAELRDWSSLCREVSAACGIRLPLLCTAPLAAPENIRQSLEGSTGIRAVLFADLWSDLRRGRPETVLWQQAGSEVWAYAALVQYPDAFLAGRGVGFRPADHHPPVWLTDFAPMNYRIAPWLCAVNGWTGLLYWDSLTGSAESVKNAATFREGDAVFNGDGHLVYPSPAGPLPSLRLKWLRDGMEDHALFDLARARNKPAAMEIARRIAPAVDGWSQDPGPLGEARRQLAKIASER